ncbi:MAG: D-alanyl-D-alanine carboxypeptidase, partial [Ferruginibacter sp.]
PKGEEMEKIESNKINNTMKLQHSLFLVPCSLFILVSCSVSKKISKQANAILLNDTAISKGHIGISIYEPATNTYWYNYNADKYFIPASNTKLFTLYAGMKYLGDSLVGLRYFKPSGQFTTYVLPTGDPTLLHQDFKPQPVIDFLKKRDEIFFLKAKSEFNYLGNGWAWNDYNDDYMVERSVFPMYGNVFSFSKRNQSLISIPYFSLKNFTTLGFPINFNFKHSDSVKATIDAFDSGFFKRDQSSNKVTFIETGRKFSSQQIPIHIKDASEDIVRWIKDTINSGRPQDEIIGIAYSPEESYYFYNSKENQIESIFNPIPEIKNVSLSVIHSQPSDSLFKPMMHRSDNFFAEQTLLMVSNEHLGYMSDEKIIDTLLKTDLRDVPQKPKWVDGSGLSRYNLFTPQSFVYILNKTKNEFGWDRVKNILATGGTGTLTAYFKKDSGFIYAKTGTLSNNCALSGFLITQKGKLLIFSVLTNNYPTGATPVRKAVEKFLLGIRKNY